MFQNTIKMKGKSFVCPYDKTIYFSLHVFDMFTVCVHNIIKGERFNMALLD